MYHAEKAKWQAARRALGRPCDDATLRALHTSVGAPHSSTAFSQDDLTRVIGAFKSVSAMDDFNAQMKAQGTMKERLIEEITALQAKSDIKGGITGLARYFNKWLGGKSIAELDEATLRKLRGMLDRRVKQLQPAPGPTAGPTAEDDGDPF
jgi:hypothetical protein